MNTYKILGMSSPAATSNTTAYTVPASTAAIVSTISVCNANAAAITFRLFVVPSGSSAAQTNALYYGVSIPANDNFSATFGITLGPGDSVVIYASTTNVIFHLYGSEVS